MRKWNKAFLAGMMAVSLAASSAPVWAAEENTETAAETPEENAEAETTEEGTESGYPVTISTFNFALEPVEETFEKAPEKVICAWTNSVETMLALGLGDKITSIIGVTEKDITPSLREEYEKVKDKEFNDFTDSNAAMSQEVALSLEPDFILAWKSTFSDKSIGDVDFWQERGVNTYMALNSNDVSAEKTLENEYQDILTIGKIFNVEDKAQEIVDNMKSTVEQATQAAKEQEKHTAIIVEYLGDSVRVYDKTSLAGDMAVKMGAELLETGTEISEEDLLKYNPDDIFIVYMGAGGTDAESKDVEELEAADAEAAEEAVKTITENPAFASLNAVKNNAVHPLLLSDCYTSGIRTINGLNTFGEALYPDTYKAVEQKF